MKTPQTTQGFQETPHRAARFPWAFGVIFLIGLATRIWGLRLESAWCDEALTLLCLPAENAAAFFRGAFERDPRLIVSPLYYGLEYAWAATFGGSVATLRLLSVTLDLATLAVLYHLARRLGGRRAAGFTGLLYALSLVHIHYAQEVRFYALMAFFAAVSLLGYVMLTEKEGSCLGWALHLGADALLLWTHAFTALFFAAPGLAALWRGRRDPKFFARWLGGHLAVLALYFFWIFGLLRYDFATHSQAYCDSLPGVRELINAGLIFFGGRFSNINPASYYPAGFSFEVPLLFLKAILVSLGVAWLFRKKGASTGLLLASAVLLPPLLLFAASYAWRPCFMYRYVYYAGLPLCLLAGCGLASLKIPWRYCLALLLISLLLYQYAALPRPMRPGYAQAAATLPPPSEAHPTFAFKYFNALGAEYACRPAGPIHSIESFPALCEQVIKTLRAGQPVTVYFYRWEKIEAFEAACRKAGARVERKTWGGVPPLISCTARPACAPRQSPLQ